MEIRGVVVDGWTRENVTNTDSREPPSHRAILLLLWWPFDKATWSGFPLHEIICALIRKLNNLYHVFGVRITPALIFGIKAHPEICLSQSSCLFNCANSIFFIKPCLYSFIGNLTRVRFWRLGGAACIRLPRCIPKLDNTIKQDFKEWR